MKIYPSTKEFTIYKIIKSFKRNLKKNIFLNRPKTFYSDYNYVNKAIKKKELSTYGFYTNIFEKKLKKFTKSKYVICTNSGTSALHLALLSLKIGPNDEVFVPGFSFISASNAVLYCKAIPHFIDIEKNTMGVDPIKLKQHIKKNFTFKKNRLINKKTKRPLKAIIVVYAYGYAPRMDLIKNICKKYNVKIIEDSAEALGTYYKKKHAGTFGDVGILSFNGNKIITSGCGGAVLTNSQNLEKKIRHLATLGKVKNNYFEYDTLAYNYRLPSINAALGISQLKNLKKIISERIFIHKSYIKIFKTTKFFEIFEQPKYSKSNYWLNILILKNNVISIREKILKLFLQNKINCVPGWKTVHSMNYLKKFPKSNLDQSKLIARSIINLPSNF